MRETIVKIAAEAEKCGDCQQLGKMDKDSHRAPWHGLTWCTAYLTFLNGDMRCRYCLDGEAELERLKSSNRCPCCTHGVNVMHDVCQECHGTGSLEVAYQQLRVAYKLQGEELDRLMATQPNGEVKGKSS